jgi:hypothetical protein
MIPAFALTVLVALTASAALAQPAAAGFSPEERLEGIRASLVQAALAGATRVDSVAWIDGQGVLREGSSFRSGMQVRGVQVLGYRRDSNGQPQAQLKLPAETSKSLPTANASAGANSKLTSASKASVACDKVPALRHLIGLQLAVEGQWSSQDAPLAHAMGEFGRAQWLRAGSMAPGWRMLAQSSQKGSMYEQILTGASEQPLPWQAVLSLSPALGMAPAEAAGAPAVQAGAPLTQLQSWWGDEPTVVRLHFSLAPQGQGHPVFQASADISVPAQAQGWGNGQLPAATREQVARQIGQWAQALGGQIGCESVKPEVVRARGSELRINVGALAGVRPGDEWLLADQRRFPLQILEPGVAGQAVLARVQQVYAHHAQLQVLAGPADQVKPTWRAWPSQSLLSGEAQR